MKALPQGHFPSSARGFAVMLRTLPALRLAELTQINESKIRVGKTLAQVSLNGDLFSAAVTMTTLIERR